MSDYSPIIYLISAIGAEVLKDISKHLGKKTYQLAASLQEPIISLNINDYTDYQEIENKLDSRAIIRSKIEKIVVDNREEFNELIRVLHLETSFPTNNFRSEDGEKIINIGTNFGHIGAERQTAKKEAATNKFVVFTICMIGVLIFTIVAMAMSGFWPTRSESSQSFNGLEKNKNSNTAENAFSGEKNRKSKNETASRKPNKQSNKPQEKDTPSPCALTSDPSDGC
jgi:hypothetical protein